jgi:hypothetical protein
MDWAGSIVGQTMAYNILFWLSTAACVLVIGYFYFICIRFFWEANDIRLDAKVIQVLGFALVVTLAAIRLFL